MVADIIQHFTFYHHRMGFGWILITLHHALLTYFTSFSLSGMLVNGGVVNSSKAHSSPSHVIATKGSSVWLHWNYTYIGDGIHEKSVYLKSTYKEQIIGINSISHPRFQALAKRIGESGTLTLESPVPAPFTGRVDVISSNSTLVIHDLQYDDSTYRVSSDVNVHIDIDAGPILYEFRLKPVVSLTVIGIPEFVVEPPSEVEVNEHSSLELTIELEGNPKPKAYFRWSHRSSLSVVTASSGRSNPFRYHAKYKLYNVDASFCGERLQTTLRNSLGSSTTKHVRVVVLLKLEEPLKLKAERLSNGTCVKVNWKKIKSGACKVKYLVKLKDSYGKELNMSYGYNIGGMKMCNILPHEYVTHVELTVQFRWVMKTVIAIVGGKGMLSSRKEIFTTLGTIYSHEDNKRSKRLQSTNGISQLSMSYPVSKDSQPAGSLRSTNINIYIIIGILSLLAMTVILVMPVILKRMMKTSGNRHEQSRVHTQPESHYMELQPQTKKEKSNYAELEVVNEYAEIL